MTYPRSHLIDPQGGTYHVCSRFVRRTFLCGVDALTGKDFSHRRKWIEDRILELSQIFSISIYAYAVMSNHYHIVLTITAIDLSDDEVAERWLMLCPVKQVGDNTEQDHNFRKSWSCSVLSPTCFTGHNISHLSATSSSDRSIAVIVNTMW